MFGYEARSVSLIARLTEIRGKLGAKVTLAFAECDAAVEPR